MTIVYNTAIVRTGLVLHLDAANPKSYPGTGTNWTDLSGNSRNGTLINGVGYNSGSLVFDGTNDHAVVSPYIRSSAFIDRTMSVWFKVNGANIPGGSSQGLCSVFDDAEGNPQISMEVNANGLGVAFNTFYDGTVRGASKVIALNTWYNAVGIETQTPSRKIQLYVNGVLEAETAAAGTSYSVSATKLNVGCQKVSMNRFFNGTIGIVQLYERVLSIQEIAQNFEALRGRFGI